MTALFQDIPAGFKSHSGASLFWKIECDALMPDDWAGLARILSESLPPFERVVGIPRGGLPFAKALERYARPGAGRLLIADDVLTTGGSMIEYRAKILGDPMLSSSLVRSRVELHTEDVLGVVAFARAWPDACASWVVPGFVLGAELLYVLSPKADQSPEDR